MELLDKLKDIYRYSPSILEWDINSCQTKVLTSIPNIVASSLDIPKVVSTHTSTSVLLPVSCFKLNHDSGFILLRDNFYDIKMAVVSKYPIDMPYHLVHKELSQEAYDAEKKRCIDYCSKHSSYNPKEYEGDAWMLKWSGDSIIRDHGKIWRASCVSSVYCEGMSRVLSHTVFKPFETNLDQFVCALGTYAQVAVIIDFIQNSNKRQFYLEREKLSND